MATAEVEVRGSRLSGIVSQPTLVLAHAAVLVACVVAAVAISTPAQWHPLKLLVVLAIFGTVSEMSTVEFPVLRRSLSSVALVLAMAFLGPAPTMALALVPIMVDSARNRLPAVYLVNNLANYALVTLVGSLAAGALLGGHPPEADLQTLLVAITALSIAVDFATFVGAVTVRAVHSGVSIRRSFRREFVPATPYLLISAAFTGAAGVVWVTAGTTALAGLLLVLLASGRLVKVVAREEEREQQVAELAIERARLLGESLTAEERERTRLAGDIHDDALQQLALAELELRSASAGNQDALARGRRSVAAASAALRATLAHIVPAAEMRSDGLDSALEAIVADLCEPSGLDWAVTVDPDVVLDDRTLICSLARELVTNAVKHAGARRLDVDVQRAEATVRLDVRDDGTGFRPRARRPGHVGLALVENRARAADGRVTIESAPGEGTRVLVELPLQPG
jgi:signal transduction histidine kinase